MIQFIPIALIAVGVALLAKGENNETASKNRRGSDRGNTPDKSRSGTSERDRKGGIKNELENHFDAGGGSNGNGGGRKPRSAAKSYRDAEPVKETTVDDTDDSDSGGGNAPDHVDPQHAGQPEPDSTPVDPGAERDGGTEQPDTGGITDGGNDKRNSQPSGKTRKGGKGNENSAESES